MIKRAWNWLLGIEGEKQPPPRLIDLVKQKDSSPDGGFVRLNNDLALFFDDYEEKDPMVMMSYAYARRIAAAGMFFQGLAGKDLFDYVYDIFKSCQISTGVSVEFQEQAGAQGVELALKYLPEMSRDSLRLMTGLAAQGVNAFGSQPLPSMSRGKVLKVDECELILSKAKGLTGEGKPQISCRGEDEDYLIRVAGMLEEALGEILPSDSAYELASECLAELREKISQGMFYDGANPREKLMVYYSLCSMLDESGKDDRQNLMRVTIAANILKDEVEHEKALSYLEKGVVEFGRQALSSVLDPCSSYDIESVKSNVVNIIMGLMVKYGGEVVEHDVVKIVDNVTARVGENEAAKVGEEILALSVMSNATGYYIDQKDFKTARAYFKCVEGGISLYVKGRGDAFNEHQHGALRMVIQGFNELSEELGAIN